MSRDNLDNTTEQYVSGLRSAQTPRAERRRYPRYRCAGNVQLRTQGDTVRTWGTFTDISRSGCYVELQATFPPGTNMYLLLELHGYRVHTKAVVRVTYPFVGMGLEFKEITEDNLGKLDHLLAMLASTTGSGLETAQQEAPSQASGMHLPAITDAVSAIDAVIKHFHDSDRLNREEFLVLIRESQAHSHF